MQKQSKKALVAKSASNWNGTIRKYKNVGINSFFRLSSILSINFRMFEIFDIHTITDATFFCHQERYLQPAVHSVWTKQQQSILHNLKESENPIAVAGDGRTDSPGHTTTYGTYTLYGPYVELSCNKIIDSQMVNTPVVCMQILWC